MVTFIPAKDDWAEAFKQIGGGAAEGYMNRADETAIQKAISGLGANPSARDLLNAITNTRTYSPQAKQNVIKNYLGTSEFEELQRKAKENERLEQSRIDASRETEGVKARLKELEEEKKQQKNMNDALTLIDAADLEQTDKDALREKVKAGEASYEAIKEVLKPNKEKIAKEEKEENKKVTQNAFNNLVELIPEVGKSGILTSKLGGNTAKAYAKFNTLTGALEAHLVDMVSRGALSKERFKYIVETLLPKPSDTQNEIKGKLEALAIDLQLDDSLLRGESTSSEPPSNGRPPWASFYK